MSLVVRIDPTRCRGHAICSLFFSEGVELDSWGYGRIVEGQSWDRRSIKRALRVAAACPNDAVVIFERE